MVSKREDSYNEIDFKLYYDARGNSFELWVIYAQALKKSADILWNATIEAMLNEIWYNHNNTYDSEDTQQIDVYMMLMGMAVENLFKAIYVQGNADLAKDGFMRKPWKNGHNLEGLAELIKWKPLNESDAELIRDLAKYIEQGRYPITQRFNFENFPKGYVTPSTKHRIDRIYNDLLSEIKLKESLELDNGETS